MADTIKMYFRFIKVSFQAQLQYRLSFFMQTIAQFIINFSEFIGIYALFSRFGNIKGWILPEIAVLYGMISVGFSINDALTRGFDIMGNLIRMGELDRILLRPRSTILQLFGFELTLKRIGRFLQGLLVLIYGFYHLNMDWSIGKVLMILWTISGSCFLFMGLIMIQATISFWTIESLEIMNTMTYGGLETAQYPMTIYKDWFRKFFTFIVPLACVNYFPVLFIIGKQDPLGSSILFQVISPIAGYMFLAAGILFWNFGIRHYKSTGS